MKGSRKARILNYLRLRNLSTDCSRVERGLVSKSLSGTEIGIEILLYLCVTIFLGYFTVVSVAATPQIAQVNSTASINRPTLKLGSQGEYVSELQAALKLLGFYTGAVDGVYNNITASAVSRFKQSVGLNPDGVVDATTWQKLFPSDSTGASSVSSSNSASKFPVPSQTSNTTKVVNPNTTATNRGVNRSPEPKPTIPNTTATNRGVNPSPEPKPTTPSTTATNRGVNPSPEPKPTTPNTTATNRGVNPSPEPKPTTPSTTATNRGVNPNPEPKPTTPNTTANSQKTPVRQSSPTHSQSQQTAGTQRNPAIQYTSEGLPILRVGMHGPEVVKLQQKLQKLGFFDGNIDGDFGAKTETAVKAAQQRYGMEADGIVGAGTWEVLTRRR